MFSTCSTLIIFWQQLGSWSVLDKNKPIQEMFIFWSLNVQDDRTSPPYQTCKWLYLWKFYSSGIYLCSKLFCISWLLKSKYQASNWLFGITWNVRKQICITITLSVLGQTDFDRNPYMSLLFFWYVLPGISNQKVKWTKSCNK